MKKDENHFCEAGTRVRLFLFLFFFSPPPVSAFRLDDLIISFLNYSKNELSSLLLQGELNDLLVILLQLLNFFSLSLQLPKVDLAVIILSTSFRLLWSMMLQYSLFLYSLTRLLFLLPFPFPSLVMWSRQSKVSYAGWPSQISFSLPTSLLFIFRSQNCFIGSDLKHKDLLLSFAGIDDLADRILRQCSFSRSDYSQIFITSVILSLFIIISHTQGHTFSLFTPAHCLFKGQLFSFSITIEIPNSDPVMHSKLSMKNLQTFGHDNPFVRERSLSSRPKQEYELAKNQGSPTPSPHLSSGKPVQPLPQTSLRPGESRMGAKSGSYSCNQIIYLLSNEQECLQRVKETVERDRRKVMDNFDDFKQTVNNIIDDLKLSVTASIDGHYQHFVDQFRSVKLEYSNYCHVKREFWSKREGEIEKAEKHRDGTVKYPGMVVREDRSQIDNQALLLNMIEDMKDYKKHINYVEFSDTQDRILRPLLKTSKSMIRQLGVQSYYQASSANATFKVLQQLIENNVHKIYERMDLFVVDNKYEEGQLVPSGIKNWNPQLQEEVKQGYHPSSPAHKAFSPQAKSFRLETPLAPNSIPQHRVPECDDVEEDRQSWGLKSKNCSTANTEFKSSSKSKRFSNGSDYIEEGKQRIGFNGPKAIKVRSRVVSREGEYGFDGIGTY